jgi:propionyl-CoA carboxylase alpha chain
VINRLLVANRGEIAHRVFRTCRDLGIETVAVHSDADAGLAYVREADVAVLLPGTAPADTYLRRDLLVQAALRSEADAVHPGYGFLSEDADFARRVIAAGLTWVGPTPESIEQMASKVQAKKLMSDAGVPVLPELGLADLREADLPLLVKASAGGGGRGMRVVRRVADVRTTVDEAAAEATSAFGDPTVFCEPYVEHARHVEVQVWGDGAGRIVVLGDRDCSTQRRHQKVVEEAPAPALSDATRGSMHDAARTAAETIGYAGAGTVEFLLDPGTGRFWFLEMNTRLQVEHPVTEAVTGLDLVALQIRAAERAGVDAAERTDDGPGTGEAFSQVLPSPPGGHAVEVRVYAEDPSRKWRPQSGRLTRFDIPDVGDRFTRTSTYGVRVDAGFSAGDEIGTHYDAMLAKVVSWAPTRQEALRRLADVLRRSRIHGVRTNRDLLVALLRHRALTEIDMSTSFLDTVDVASLMQRQGDAARPSRLAAAVAPAEQARQSGAQAGIPSGWRNVTSQPQRTRFTHPDEPDQPVTEVAWYGGHDGYRSDSAADPDVVEASTTRVVLADGEVRRVFEVYVAGDRVDVESSMGHVALRTVPRFADPSSRVPSGSLLAPMPGSVVSLVVAPGDQIRGGQPILVLEAMKMQHTVRAPVDGVVSEVTVAVGDQAAAGSVLAVVRPHTPAVPAEGEDR